MKLRKSLIVMRERITQVLLRRSEKLSVIGWTRKRDKKYISGVRVAIIYDPLSDLCPELVNIVVYIWLDIREISMTMVFRILGYNYDFSQLSSPVR